MRLLLDTHVVLWSLLAPDRLAREAREAIEDPSNDACISVVSAWEVAIKQSLRKLVLPGPAESWLQPACAATGLSWVPVDVDAALRVRSLPWHHRDPFDRLLIAQALGGFHLVTRDHELSRYQVPVLPG